MYADNFAGKFNEKPTFEHYKNKLPKIVVCLWNDSVCCSASIIRKIYLTFIYKRRFRIIGWFYGKFNMTWICFCWINLWYWWINHCMKTLINLRKKYRDWDQMWFLKIDSGFFRWKYMKETDRFSFVEFKYVFCSFHWNEREHFFLVSLVWLRKNSSIARNFAIYLFFFKFSVSVKKTHQKTKKAIYCVCYTLHKSYFVILDSSRSDCYCC